MPYARLAGTLSDVDDTKAGEPGSVAVALRPSHPQDYWLEILEAGVAGVAAGFTNAAGADIYNDVKGACRAAVERLRDQEPDPDEHSEYVHQIVAETFIGLCPPGHKLVHLNGIFSDNRLVNLAYVPKPDPRPAAPLNPRTPGPGKTAPARKKRRNGKGKRSA